MKGTYKVYDSNKGEWVNLDHTAAYDNVRIKIENNHLWVSYNYDQGPWEDKGEISSGADLSGKADKTYVDKNFAKKEDIPTDYIVNTGNDDNIEITRSLECGDKVGLELGSDYSKLSFASEVGSSETEGGILTLSNSAATLKAYDDGDSEGYELPFYNELTIRRDGLKYNGSKVLYIDDDGVLNNNSLTVGNLVVEEADNFNYTFEGKLPYEGGVPLDEGCYTVTAVWNGEDAEYVEYMWHDSDWYGHVYKFIVTDCTSTLEESYSSERWNGGELTLPAYLIDSDYSDEGDTLEFIDGKTETVYITGSNANIEEEKEDSYIIHEPLGYFTQVAPFSLRRATKVTLNGQKIVTKDTLDSVKENILEQCVGKDVVSVSDRGDRDVSTYIERSESDDGVVDKQSRLSVDKNSITINVGESNPDGYLGMETKFQNNELIVMRRSDEQTQTLFKIDANGDFYILKGGQLKKLQDLLT